MRFDYARLLADARLAGPADAAVVLAYVAAWTPASAPPADLQQIQTHLRALGAPLIIVSTDGAWRWSRGGAADRPARVPDEPWPVDEPALVIVDADGAVRFAEPWRAPEAPITATLAEGLAAAVRELRSPAGTAWTRREWLATSLVAGIGLALLDAGGRARPATAAPEAIRVSGDVEVTLNVNGAPRKVRIDPRVSLLDCLRERMGLPGTKKGCDHGQCGACTVHVNGQRVLSCLTLAITLPGAEIVTIEGIARGDALHPVQAAFIQHDAFQCGFCTPGQIMSAVALLREGAGRTDAEVREQMSGNICRCAAYPNIVAAIQQARREG